MTRSPSLPAVLQPPVQLLESRLHGLYVITDARMGGGHLAIARAALEGGAAILQLRDKDLPPGQLWSLAWALRALTRAAGALFIVNDRVDLALASGADGVHLGPEDMPLATARRVLGPHLLIGASCAGVSEAQGAERAGANYIGAGAIFGTATKSDAGPAVGLDHLRAMVGSTRLPVAAIGGVNHTNIAATVAAGAAMACVVSAVAAAGEHGAMVAATGALIRRAQF